MNIYFPLTGYNESIVHLECVTLNGSGDLFKIAGGIGSTGVGFTGLDSTGFLFYGYDGKLFDQSGHFFGGYNQKRRFELEIHVKDDNTQSYYHNGKLIANNLSCSFVDYLEVQRASQSMDIIASHYGDPNNIFTGQFLFLSGNGLLFSGQYLF